nr:hypothetical protein [Tanacetum cinerariifolium]
MSTQQDIYTAGSENHPPMLNKDNYVPWSSRIIRYSRSRPNGKMIVDSIENGPYVRRMITTPGEPDLPVPVPESLHEQTDEELTETDIKRMDADDQAIQTILLGLPEDVYVAEIWERVRQMMKGSDIGEQEKEAKLYNEWEKFTSTDGESIESYYHRFMQLMNDLKRNKHFSENIASNIKFLNNLQPEWKRHVTIICQTKNLHEADFTQIYDFLKMNQEEVNELRAEHLAKSHDPLALMAHSQNLFNFPTTHKDQSSSSTHPQQSFPINNKYNPQPALNRNFMQPPTTSLEDINDPTEAMNATLILFAKAFQLSAPTNNNQRTSSNPRNRQIAQPVMNMGHDRQIQNVGGNGGNQFGQYARQVAQNQQGYNAWQNGIANQGGTGNVVAAMAEGSGNGNQARCYNCRGLGHIARNCTARPRRRDAAYLQTQLLIVQKEEAWIQLQAEEFNFMAAAGDLDEIEEVNANCILMANFQQASTSGTQHDKAPVYDTDGLAEVHLNDNCYDNEIFQEEQYTDLLEPIPEPQLVPQNDNHVTFVTPSMGHSGVKRVNRNMRATNAELKSELARYKIQEQRVEISQEKYDKLEKCYQKSVYQEQCLTRKINALHLSSAKQITTLNDEISNLNKQISKEKSSISSLMEEKKKLKHDFKIQKMALGYPNPSYLKKAQLKQQSLYNGNLLLEEHDPPAVGFCSSNDQAKEELFLSNVSNMVTVSKMISIPNEDLSDDTTPSVARKFLNEVKSYLVTLQRVVKQKMTLEVHNWSSSAHKEVHRIISHKIAPIINQVDARVQNFEIQFLQEATKFVRDFKSLVKEADEYLDKQKSLELKIERLLKESVSHDIMSIEKEYAVLWNNWYTKYEECKYEKISYDKAYNDMQQKVERLQAQLRDLKGKSSDTLSASNTLDPLNQKLESKIVELEFQVVNYEREISHLKTTYKNLFDSIKFNRAHAKLYDLIYENAQLRACGFENTSESMKNSSGTSSHSVPQPREFNVVKHRNVIASGMVKINPSQTHRVDLVPNKQSSASIRTNPITNSQRHVIVKENVCSNTVTASSTGLVNAARTRRPQPKGNTRNARIPSASKSSEVKKNVTVEDHRRTLLLSKNQKTMSSECNNIKPTIWNDKSEIICDTCKQCLVTANHDACLPSSVNALNSRENKLCANVPLSANEKRHRKHVWKPKHVGSKERLAPKPRLPRFSLKWSPSGRSFDLKGKLVAPKETNFPNDDKACTSNPQEPMRKRFLNSTVFLGKLSKYVYGLGHNLFSVGQFCDADLENAFRRNTCFIRDLDGVDLLKGNRSKNLYTINLYDMASASPICLMALATPTKSWLWHQRLSLLNFDTINDLAKNDLVSGLPKFKYAKEHLCPSCEQGKSKRASHPPKPVSNSKQRLHLLHMDLCGPMRVASINGKRYVRVIVDDYSRYTWVYFLRTKDETPEVIKNFLKKIYVRLQASVIIVRTDNKTEFKNQVLKECFDSVGITHKTSAAKTPQQNGVVERINRTLVEAARTMLIFSHASLFLWAEAIATACYTQNHSIIHRRFNKTPYELIQGRKPDISYLYVFGALCYPKNDREDIGKLGAKGDSGFFIGYSANSVAYRVYNRRTKKIIETMNVTPSERDLDILFEPLNNEYLGGRPSAVPRTIPVAPVLQNLQAPTASMSFQDSALRQKNLTPSPTAFAVDNVSNAVFEGDLLLILLALLPLNLEKRYTMSITKTKAARYEIDGIEDMVLMLWSTTKVVYNKDAKKGIKHWDDKRQMWYC